MKLIRKPRVPSSLPLVGLIALPTIVPEQWKFYLEGHSVTIAESA